MVIKGIYIPDEMDKQTRMIFDNLRKDSIPGKMQDQIGDWLLDDQNGDIKENVMSELFDSTFDYEETPRKRSYEMLREFMSERDVSADMNRNNTKTPRKRLTIKVAAALIPIMVAVGGAIWLVNWAKDSPVHDPIAAVSAPARDDITAADSGTPEGKRGKGTVIEGIGNMTTYRLPDNSVVRLSEGSRLCHRQTFEGGRVVKLKGEAQFDVIKATNSQNTFTVLTPHMTIAVLGTGFKVNSHKDGTQSSIDLYHGKIKVDVGGSKIMMAPGDRLVFRHDSGEVTVAQIPLKERTYDKMPGLVFLYKPIAEVLATVENLFGVHFEVNGNLSGERSIIHGDFTCVRSLDELMGLLQLLSGQFSYEITDSTIIVNSNKI